MGILLCRVDRLESRRTVTYTERWCIVGTNTTSTDAKLPKLTDWGMYIALGSIALLPGISFILKALFSDRTETMWGIALALIVDTPLFAFAGVGMFLIGTSPRELCMAKWQRTVWLLVGPWMVMVIFFSFLGYDSSNLWFFLGHVPLCVLSALLFYPLYRTRKYYLQHPNAK